MTSYQEEMLGRAMLRKSLSEGHRRLLPKNGRSFVPEDRTARDLPTASMILAYLKSATEPLRVYTVAMNTGISYSDVSRCLKLLESAGKARRSVIKYGQHWEVVQQTKAPADANMPCTD